MRYKAVSGTAVLYRGPSAATAHRVAREWAARLDLGESVSVFGDKTLTMYRRVPRDADESARVDAPIVDGGVERRDW